MTTDKKSSVKSKATKTTANGKPKISPLAKGLVRGFKELRAWKRGEIELRTRTFHIPADFISAREVRLKTGLSQAQFADRFGFNVRTLQNWEQGREFPEGALKAYLKVIDRMPDAVVTALAS